MTNVQVRNSVIKNRIAQMREKDHQLFWLLMAGFMALLFIRNVFWSFPVILLLGYVCVIAAFSDHDEIIALAVSFIPFSAAFQYRYALIILIAIYIIKYPKTTNRIDPKAYIPLLILMFWEMLHGIKYSFSFSSFLQGFSELIFCTFVISLPNKKFDYKFISRVFAVSTVFSCSVLLLKLLLSVNFNFLAIFMSGNYRLGINDRTVTNYAFNYNPNALGAMCNIAIATLLLRMKLCTRKIVDVLLCLALAMFGLLTLSRSFIICFLLLILLFVLSAEKNFAKKIKIICFLLAILIVTVIIIQSFMPYVFENLTGRFQEDDISNGRNDLWVEYNEHIFLSVEYSLFGIGLQNIYPKMENIYTVPPDNVPHNGIQEIVVVWGFVGLVFFVVYMFSIVFVSFESKTKKQLLNFVPIIIWAIKIMSGQMITSGKDLLMLTLFYVVFCTNFSQDINEELINEV